MGNTSGTRPKQYTAWLDTCFSAIITYYVDIKWFVDTWKLFSRIIHAWEKFESLFLKLGNNID